MSIKALLRPSPPLPTVCARCRQVSTRTRLARVAAVLMPTDVGAMSLANAAGQTSNDPSDAPPRWARTPPAMRAPVRVRPRNENDEFLVNEDPRRLDAAYRKMLGPGGENMLTESVKWLAVTHKSFDHGSRGFNERLGFLGKRIVELQLSLALLNQPRNRKLPEPDAEDTYGRIPFKHQALQNLENINVHIRERVLDKRRLAQLAQEYGLGSVIRWKPKQIDNLHLSGIEYVLAQTIYAIIGALALQRGGEVANQAARQKILQPLGFS